ncbi:hypothetical protein SAMN05216276_1021109 [Streptosporangium subroseum]|uniref:Uncharacterized protein n=1 Tax=Streptosporangium subroseum TaxID=106412 RepID=A0A239J4A5_9ACTN|nr:hypothetical protein [Streptosporangium subroseum]SNT00650.1 hypothetical protein SAMN05216276_1021109 [Streptosporangium subroseum]
MRTLSTKAISADLSKIVGPVNVEVRPAALVPYRTDATFGFAGLTTAVVRPSSPTERSSRRAAGCPARSSSTADGPASASRTPATCATGWASARRPAA